MAQKLLAPFKKFPSQVQSLPGIKQIFDGKRLKLQKELFGFTKCADFGLPKSPSAIAHDSELNLLAIGFESGLLEVVGAPGVAFSGTHPDHVAVRRVLFIPNEGRVVSLTGNNKVFLWEINENDEGAGVLEIKKDLQLPNDEDGHAITSMSLCGERLYIGREDSQIRQIDVKEWKELEDDELSVDKLSSVCSDRFKEQLATLNGHWGAVTSIEYGGPQRGLLISYSQGLALVYREGHVVRLILRSTEPRLELECACWCPGTADSFMTSFDSGSYSLWTEDISQTVASTNPYGPMPCWSIPKIVRFVIPDGTELIAFVGGLPRAEYSELESVTLQQGGEPGILLSLKLSSPVVDILPLHSGPNEPAHSLLVVCRDEVVGLDFRRKGYPCYELPYLRNFKVNQSDVTALALPEEPLSDEVTALLEGLSEEDTEWPVTGGRLISGDKTEKSEEEKKSGPAVFLATGHADGSVAVWRLDSTTAAVRRLAVVETSSIFVNGASTDAEKTSDWPPLRAVGEQRRGPPPPQPPATAEGEAEGESAPAEPPTPLAVSQLIFARDGSLVIGGKCGQVSLWTPSSEAREVECDVIKVVADLIPEDQKSFWRWQGMSPLAVQEGELPFPASAFAPAAVIQLDPPGQLRSLAYSPDWSLLAAGSNHGYALVDVKATKIVATKSTLPEHSTGDESAAAGDAPESEGRVANIRKSLRNSFRRLKKLRPGHSSSYNVEAQASGEAKEKEGEEKKDEEKKDDEKAEKKEGEEEKEKPAEAEGEAAKATESEEKAPEATPEAEGEAAKAEEEAPAAAPEETEEATPPPPPEPKDLTDDSKLQSAVRCLILAKTATQTAADICNNLLVGTNGGMVFISRLTKGEKIDETKEETPDEWDLSVMKRITMKHGAPVVHMSVLDAKAHHTPLGCTITGPCSEKPAEDVLPEETKSEGAIDEKTEEKPEEPEKEKEEEKKEEKTEEKSEEKEGEEKESEKAKEAEDSKAAEGTSAKSKCSTLPASSGGRASTLLQKTLTLGRGRSHSTTTPEFHHELLVCTEEQAKLYALPSLRVKNKAKVGDAETRVLCGTTQQFRHQDHSIDYNEFDLTLALSNGQVTVLSLPTLRKQIVAREAGKADAKAVTLGCCTSVGLFAQGDSSTLGSFNLSISTPISLRSVGAVDLPEGARPPKEEPKPEETKADGDKTEETGEKEGEAAATAAVEGAGDGPAETGEAKPADAEKEKSEKEDAVDATEEKEEVGELSEKMGDVSLGSNKIADITQDSIKEYVEGTCGGDEETKTSVVVHEEKHTTKMSIKDGEVTTTTTTTTTEKEINEDGEKVASTTTVSHDRVAVEAGEGN